jgi:hypothetical protein
MAAESGTPESVPNDDCFNVGFHINIDRAKLCYEAIITVNDQPFTIGVLFMVGDAQKRIVSAWRDLMREHAETILKETGKPLLPTIDRSDAN